MCSMCCSRSLRTAGSQVGGWVAGRQGAAGVAWLAGRAHGHCVRVAAASRGSYVASTCRAPLPPASSPGRAVTCVSRCMYLRIITPAPHTSPTVAQQHQTSCLPSPLPPPHHVPADSQGRTVSFKNTLIILTSNVGSAVIAKGGSTIGFQLPSAGDPEADAYARVRTLVLEELKVGGWLGWVGGWAGLGEVCCAMGWWGGVA